MQPQRWPIQGMSGSNGARIQAPGRMVRQGDVITVALDRRVRVLKVRAFAGRRGSAASASLYEELT
jgi:ribosome-associated heat shock protein Hsp15